jgi:hypothetical protein
MIVLKLYLNIEFHVMYDYIITIIDCNQNIFDSLSLKFSFSDKNLPVLQKLKKYICY